MRLYITVQHIFSPVVNFTRIGGLKQIYAPQKCGFTGSGCADHRNDLASGNRKINIPQYLMRAKGL